MRPARFVRTPRYLVLLTLAGFVLGCGEQAGSGPVPTKEESKKIAAEMKRDQLERKAARAGQRP